jgi:sulfonate transport system substrate-binding protein
MKTAYLIFTAGLLFGTGAMAAADVDGVVAKGTGLPAALPSTQRVAKVGLNEWVAVAQKKGWLQEEFAKQGATVEVVDIRAVGAPSVEASLFRRGDLHIAQRMAYPSLQHRANGFDLVVVWAGGDCHPRRATTIVLKKSKIKNLEDLKGKSYGSYRLGCPYFATFEALKAKGIELDSDLKKGDVRFVNVTGSPALSTFLAGEIDALGTHPAYFTMAAIYDKGLVREISESVPNGEYVTGGGRALVLTLRDYATQNPDLIQAYFRAYNRTRKWIVFENHYDEAAEIVAEEYRISKSVALYTIKDESRIVLDAGQPSYSNEVDSLRHFLAWAIKNGDDFYSAKPLTDEQVTAFVDERFFEGGKYYVDTTNQALGVAAQPAAHPAGPLAIAQTGKQL